MKILVNNIKIPIEHGENAYIDGIAKYLHIDVKNISDVEIIHKSIDARNKDDIRYIYTVAVEIQDADKYLKNKKYKNLSSYKAIKYELPQSNGYSNRPIIIGAGPAGLFCAYIMVLSGLKPIILERGKDVENRNQDIADFWKTGILKPESNVQFGEGGAGTFSDGKLNTLVKDRNGRCTFVMQTFVKFGAPVNILYDAKPHVGTDILINVVKKLREYICENGGEIHFDSKVTKLLISNNCVNGVIVNDNEEILSDRVILAIGHSARDTFEMLNSINIGMESKAFAVGFRVEHPRLFIDETQYGAKNSKLLPAAAYKLTAQTSEERGVYSFCMCPGGYVVNASSENDMIAVNGMSYSKRDGNNSNSAIIVTVKPEDFGSEVLSGMHYQRKLERKAYELGKGKVPIQKFSDYTSKLKFNDINYNQYCLSDYYDFKPQIKGDYEYTDLSTLFDYSINRSFVEGMSRFGKYIHNYDASDVILSGVESRTSSPIRINRDENGESIGIKGLYPCGEGAGYAGGITSAAMDGIYIAERIIVS